MTTTNANPMHEVRSILWTLLIAATVASVAANVAHAVIRHGFTLAAIGPVLFAMLAPVALLGLFHLMSAWARAAGGRRWVFWFYLLSIVVLAAAAFRLSFAAIRDLAIGYGYGHRDAALFPLILDGLIAVCTVGLVAATRLRTELTVQVDDAPAERPTIPTVPVAAPNQAYPETLTWLAPPAARHDADQQQDHDAAPHPVTSSDAVTRQLDDAADAPAVTRQNEEVHQGDDAVIQPLALPGDADQQAGHGVGDAPVPDPVTRTSDAPPARRLASVPAAAVDDADAELIHQLVAEGASGAEAAEALGVSKSTALRRMRQVKEMAEASA